MKSKVDISVDSNNEVTLRRDSKPPSKKEDSLNHSLQSVFEKKSFQSFAKEKVVFKAESEIEKMIEDLNKVLKKKIKDKEFELI